MRTVARPPLAVWLRYRVLGRRVPERYLPWAENDIRSDGWLRRQLAVQAIAWLAIFGAYKAIVLPFEESILISDFLVVIAWFVVLAVQFAMAPRLEQRDVFRRRRARLLAVQRGEQPPSWAMDDGRGGPFIFWVLGAFALAAVITAVVTALT